MPRPHKSQHRKRTNQDSPDDGNENKKNRQRMNLRRQLSKTGDDIGVGTVECVDAPRDGLAIQRPLVGVGVGPLTEHVHGLTDSLHVEIRRETAHDRVAVVRVVQAVGPRRGARHHEVEHVGILRRYGL